LIASARNAFTDANRKPFLLNDATCFQSVADDAGTIQVYPDGSWFVLPPKNLPSNSVENPSVVLSCPKHFGLAAPQVLDAAVEKISSIIASYDVGRWQVLELREPSFSLYSASMVGQSTADYSASSLIGLFAAFLVPGRVPFLAEFGAATGDSRSAKIFASIPARVAELTEQSETPRFYKHEYCSLCRRWKPYAETPPTMCAECRKNNPELLDLLRLDAAEV
jgi:hypothetical protein